MADPMVHPEFACYVSHASCICLLVEGTEVVSALDLVARSWRYGRKFATSTMMMIMKQKVIPTE